MPAPKLPLPALRRVLVGLTVDEALSIAMTHKQQCAVVYYGAGGVDKAALRALRPTRDKWLNRRELTLIVDGETNRVTKVV